MIDQENLVAERHERPPSRGLPSHVEAEQAVLGSLILDPDAIVRVATVLNPPDYYLDKHAWIYEAILELHEAREPVDLLSVISTLDRRGRLNDVGGAAYVTMLMNAVPTAVHVEYYAHLVERAAVQRRLVRAATEIVQLAYEGQDDIDQMIDHAEELVFQVAERRISRELKPINVGVHEFYDRISYIADHQGEMLGVPTNLTQLNALLGGLQPSDLIIVAGRPGSGKTSFGLSVAHFAAVKRRKTIAIFSLEMSAEQLAQRLISAESGVDSQRLRLGQLQEDEWSRVMHAAGVLSESQIYIDDTSVLTPLEVRAKARRLKAEVGLDLVIIDYLQLMTGSSASKPESNRVQEMSYISRQLKGLARELRVPVLALSQLSRAVEMRPDKRPVLSDLRESGSIEQDADIVILIFREKTYFKTLEAWQKAHPSKEYPEHIADLIVAKHRHGPTKDIQVYFADEQARFADLDVHPDYQ